MTRKMLGTAAVVAAGLALYAGFAGLGPAADKAEEKAPPYVHVVIFHVKPDAPADAAEGLIADAHEMLAKIPSVRALRAGRPAEMVSPKFGRKDYQVGLMILFDNYEGLKAYDEHPLHAQYVKKHINNIDVTKLLVYDFENQKK
jgi:hypothetical protein